MTPSLHAFVDSAWTVVVPLLDDVPDDDEVGPGIVAIVLMVSLVVATILLWLNMRKQLGKVRFDEESAEADPHERSDADPGAADEDGNR